jgi:hypothetical protein
MSTAMTYHDKEFSHLGGETATMKLQNEHGATRWLTVSPEQIKAILEILNKTEKG